mmetsp:Transcript_42450/g.83295  ORF Transcript_42450/g.83295 Transcript_42450/m.83295 type:complete len:383 (+) Transcript_42450:13-1161(+)
MDLSDDEGSNYYHEDSDGDEYGATGDHFAANLEAKCRLLKHQHRKDRPDRSDMKLRFDVEVDEHSYDKRESRTAQRETRELARRRREKSSIKKSSRLLTSTAKLLESFGITYTNHALESHASDPSAPNTHFADSLDIEDLVQELKSVKVKHRTVQKEVSAHKKGLALLNKRICEQQTSLDHAAKAKGLVKSSSGYQHPRPAPKKYTYAVPRVTGNKAGGAAEQEEAEEQARRRADIRRKEKNMELELDLTVKLQSLKEEKRELQQLLRDKKNSLPQHPGRSERAKSVLLALQENVRDLTEESKLQRQQHLSALARNQATLEELAKSADELQDMVAVKRNICREAKATLQRDQDTNRALQRKIQVLRNRVQEIRRAKEMRFQA